MEDDKLEISESKRKKLLADYQLLLAHLNLANKIAMELGKFLDPVQDPAPKRGSLSKKRKAEIQAYVAARQKKSFDKYLNQQKRESS